MLDPDNMPRRVSMNLLGGFRLRVGERDVVAMPRKGQALLALLAFRNGDPISREAVADLLWTDRGAEQARHSLRQMLLTLRRDLRDAGDDLIRNDDQMLSFAKDAVATDVKRFRDLTGRHDMASLSDAAAVYTGPLLAGFPALSADFDDWLERSRGELANHAIEALARLADACLASGDMIGAVRATERMLEIDPLREDNHRSLMRLYLRASRRVDAIRQYARCVEILRTELDVSPSAETEALAALIRDANAETKPELPAAVWDESATLFARPSGGPPWVAVLPFRAGGADSLPAYVGAGLVEDIVALLVTLREPVVVSANSSQAYRDEAPDVRLVGKNLGVDYIVSGSVRKSGKWFRIYAELSETEDATVLWARTYDAEGLSIFEVQDNIAAMPHIRERELLKIRSKRPDNMTAYDYVLQGREMALRFERPSFDTAGQLLREACHHDPAYAAAHADLASWYSLRVGQGWSSNPAADIAAMDEAARSAIACDGNHARALSLYGHVRSFLSRDYDHALTLFERALDIAPNDAIAWKWSSATFAYIGDGKEAERRARRALELSPRDVFAFRIYSSLCIAHYVMESYEEAVRWGRL
jgi:DNA-binding SARP family transcriptional activator